MDIVEGIFSATALDNMSRFVNIDIMVNRYNEEQQTRTYDMLHPLPGLKPSKIRIPKCPPYTWV